MKKYIKFFKHQLNHYREKQRYSKVVLSEKYIMVDGHPNSINFGDALNIPLVELLSGKIVLPSKFFKKEQDTYSVIGSICQWTNENSIVWGSGFISDNYNAENFIKPKKILAVRGPLSRELYLKNQIDCPEIYGDPALLLPYIYNPQIEKRYHFGLIPHYIDKDNKWIKKNKKKYGVKFIDVEVGTDYQKFIDEMLSCEKIITSSLHGLILAQAYQIPVCRVSFSDNITGGNFKYNDYYKSVKLNPLNPIKIKNQKIDELVMDRRKINIDLKKLIDVCPFDSDCITQIKSTI